MNNEVVLTDITGTLGEWLERGFDCEMSPEIAALLYRTYKLAVSELSEVSHE